MQAGGSQQHQPPRPGVQLLHPHPRQTRQVQVNGAGADPAPAGQHGLRPAKPCQQRRAEENGSPHLCRCLPRQGALDRAAGERHIAALPLGRAARAPQQRKAALHVREPWHAPQPDRPLAEQRGRQKRQYAVFGRRDADRSVQRPPTRYHDLVPRSVPYPQPPFRKRYHRLCKGSAECQSV